MEQDKEKYAELLTKRAGTATKIVKALVITAIAVAAAMFIFLLIAIFTIDNTEAILIGMIIFISLVSVLLIAVLSLFVYAKANLEKLKKLK